MGVDLAKFLNQRSRTLGFRRFGIAVDHLLVLARGLLVLPCVIIIVPDRELGARTEFAVRIPLLRVSSASRALSLSFNSNQDQAMASCAVAENCPSEKRFRNDWYASSASSNVLLLKWFSPMREHRLLGELGIREASDEPSERIRSLGERAHGLVAVSEIVRGPTHVIVVRNLRVNVPNKRAESSKNCAWKAATPAA